MILRDPWIALNSESVRVDFAFYTMPGCNRLESQGVLHGH